MKKVITIFATCAVSLITLGILNIFNIPHKDIIFTFVSVLILLGGSFILKKQTKDAKNARRFFKTMPLRMGDFFFATVTSVIIISSSFILNYLEGLFLGLFNIKMTPSGIFKMSGSNEMVLLCLIAVIPAIFEELFFRGAVLSALSKKPDIRAMIWSAVFFTLMHGSLFNIPSTLVAGFVLAAASYWSGSVYVAMLAHFFNNVLTFLIYIYNDNLASVLLKIRKRLYQHFRPHGVSFVYHCNKPPRIKSGSVIAVYFYVIVCKVAAPRRGTGVSAVKRSLNFDLFCGENGLCRLL